MHIHVHLWLLLLTPGTFSLLTLGAHAQREVMVVRSVTPHLTYRMFIRPTNERTYLTGNEGQTICGVFSECAPLQS